MRSPVVWSPRESTEGEAWSSVLFGKMCQSGTRHGVVNMDIEHIQRVVASTFGVSRAAILAKGSRGTDTPQVRIARKVAMWLAYRTGQWSYPELGRAFCRDHTTVRTSCIHVTEYAAHDSSFLGTLLGLMNELGIQGAAPGLELCASQMPQCGPLIAGDRCL